MLAAEITEKCRQKNPAIDAIRENVKLPSGYTKPHSHSYGKNVNVPSAKMKAHKQKPVSC